MVAGPDGALVGGVSGALVDGAVVVGGCVVSVPPSLPCALAGDTATSASVAATADATRLRGTRRRRGDPRRTRGERDIDGDAGPERTARFYTPGIGNARGNWVGTRIAPWALPPATEGSTFSEVPSENVIDTAAPDRRGRKRAARRDVLLDLADDLVAESGVDGLTMTALAERADYAPASLYTYFASRSELLATLQERALRHLAAVGEAHLRSWDADLTGAERTAATPGPVAALARLWGFADVFLSAPEQHPREFALQQQLLISADAEDPPDAARVVPAALAVLDIPRRLLADAVECGSLARDASDPEQMVRTLTWIAAMNGTLLTDRVRTGLAVPSRVIGESLVAALLVGWGARPDLNEDARLISLRWANRLEES